MAGESIAAGVGAGVTGRARFRPVAAWAWMWRNFDAVLPDGDDAVPTTGSADAVPASGRPLPLRPATVLAVADGDGDEGLPLP
ncbi:hypothetical protein AB0I54_36165 [Streptomyces sp. NPDC050625]|uniref:hypothetical protein n=1 Tax=Streptomyces sp. NPDC050625 TaxID=3154629 RepID=UPI00343B5027